MKPPEKATRLGLFLALTVWMVLAGTLFLEAVSTSLGVETLTNTSAMAPEVNPGWGKLFQPYRYFVAVVALFFGYHCFARREWARKGLITVIVLDLIVWVMASAHTFLTTGGSGLEISRMFLQVFVVLFEVGLLWLLLDDHIIRDFHQRPDRVPSPRK